MSSIMMSPLETLDAVIENGASLSEAIDLGGLRVFGVFMPEAWTAAVLTFQVSFDGGQNWGDLYDAEGVEVSTTVGCAQYIYFKLPTFAAIPMIKVRSGTSASPVSQEEDRCVKLILRSV